MDQAHQEELELKAFTTESVDPRYSDLDRMSTGEIVGAMNEAEMEVPLAVRRALPQISAAIDAISEGMESGGRLFYVGAGTPGRLGVLDASECPPTFSIDPDRVVGIIAGGPDALTTAVEGAEDDRQAGYEAVALRGLGPHDSVVGVTASGRTPYVLGAVQAARDAGAVSVGISSNAGAVLSGLVDHPIEVVVGPEIITGSTRLKAGSAQKQVLNMISTVCMVRLGKTYGNLMVDVSATNRKLEARARNLVMHITGCDERSAADALRASSGKVKVAVVCLVLDVDPQQARSLLARAGGSLRSALEAVPAVHSRGPEERSEEGRTAPWTC